MLSRVTFYQLLLKFQKAQKLVEGFADFQSALSKSCADSTASQDKINSVHEECSSIPENFERLMNVKETLNYNINDRLCEIKSSLVREEKENKKVKWKLFIIIIFSFC